MNLHTINCYGVDCAGWRMIHPDAPIEALGYVPGFLRDDDPRPAREQFDERYAYGGWSPNKGFKMLDNLAIQYPGDPALLPIAWRELRGEAIVMYPGALLAIIQPDGRFEVARMD